VALLLGIGALSAVGAHADTEKARLHGDEPADSSGGVSIRAEGGRIYFSEGGHEAELVLGATSKRENLLRLLEPHGPTGVRLHADPRLIMSSGGGAGFSLHDLTRRPTGNDIPPILRAPKHEIGPRGHDAPSGVRGHDAPSNKKG
jgi:hypothetical protein